MDADRKVIALGPQGRRLKVLTVLRESPEPLRAKEIIDLLGKGWTITRVMKALRDLEARGEAEREMVSRADRIWVWRATVGT
jgi:hypothetical protein